MMDTARGNRPIATYHDFWRFYLQEHARPATRYLHFFGTGMAVLTLQLHCLFEVSSSRFGLVGTAPE